MQPLQMSKIILIVIIFLSVGTTLGVIAYSLSLKKNPPISVQPTPESTITPTPVSTVASNACPSTIVDIDNNTYKTVKIGNQCWMKENLKVTKNPEGRSIRRYCLENDPKACNTNGGLYDWNTTMNGSNMEGSRGICPVGWHVPKDSEWYVLEKGLAIGSCDADRIEFSCNPAGTKLRSRGSSGFEAIMAGFYSTGGSFYFNSLNSYFWSSSEKGADIAWDRILNLGSTINRYYDAKELGFSVRCLRD